MTIRISKSMLFIVWVWILAAVVFTVYVLSIGTSVYIIFPVAGAIFSIFNAVVCYKFYKEKITFQGDRISFYTGWLHGRVEYRLSEIVSVKYTKGTMIFNTATEKRTLDLCFLSKSSEIKIYTYLYRGSVHIIF